MNEIQASNRAQVFNMEKMIRDELPPVEIKYKDHFSYGVYGREMIIEQAGTVVTGHIHKQENMNVLLEGEILVLTESGVKQFKAGEVIVSPPGTKRVAYCVTPIRWLTIHGTFEKDVAKIEAEFVAHSEQEFLEFCEQNQLLIGE